MKFLLLAILTFITLTQADWDWSKVKTKDVLVWPKNIPKLESRIVGGDDAKPKQFPHQVGLFVDGRFLCSGSILNTKTILTAARCIYSREKPIRVVAGAHKIFQAEDSQQSMKSDDFIVHENYDGYYYRNDVALIILPRPLVFNDAIQPIELYKGPKTLEGTYATVSGWGRFDDSSSAISSILRYSSDYIVSNANCKKFFGNVLIKDYHLCLDGSNGQSPCSGDFGGPLVFQDKGKRKLAGVVSFGSAWGCSIGYPSVYSRISSFESWIKSKMPSD